MRGFIGRKLKKLTIWQGRNASSLRSFVLIQSQEIVNMFRGRKPKHIIICGPACCGATLLFNMMRYSTDENVYMPNTGTPAMRSINTFASNYITKRTLDLYNVEEIQKNLGNIRDLFFIILARDPRSLVTSMHKSVPWQYYQSWDYGFYAGPYPSMTRPGVGAAFRAIEQLSERPNIQYLIVRYEDMVEDPEKVREDISSFTGLTLSKPFSDFCRHETPEQLLKQLNGVTPPEKENAHRWMRSEFQPRIQRLQSLFPEMKSVIDAHGYINIDREESFDTLPRTGTVVAMHTPDDVYRREADRFCRSLDRLGLTYVCDELPTSRELAELPKELLEYPDWFIQKLARFHKPTWLLEKRKTLRGPLLYCDVDAFFHQDPWPYLGLYDGDVAVFSRRDGTVNSAAIWLNDKEEAADIIEEWKMRCISKAQVIREAWPKVEPSASDQPLLRDIVNENLTGQKFLIQRLPPSMLFIFDEISQTIGEDVLIEQLQASRVAKSKAYGTNNEFRFDPRERRITELEEILQSSGYGRKA